MLPSFGDFFKSSLTQLKEKGGTTMREVSPRDLEINLSHFDIPKSSRQIKSHLNLTYQQRAYDALNDALGLDNKNYNVFISGIAGSGRHTFAREVLKKIASDMPTPDDWIYVYNFVDPLSPRAIPLKAGRAKEFKETIEGLKKEVVNSISKAFNSTDYEKRHGELEEKYATKKKEIWDELNQKSLELGFAVQIGPTGIMTVPMAYGKPLTQEEYEKLAPEIKKKYEDNILKVKRLIDGTMHKSRNLDRELQSKIEKLDEEIAKFAIDPIFDEFIAKFKVNSDLVDHIKKIKKDILNNLNIFRDEKVDKDKFMIRYDVNIIVDNSKMKGAPVIEEFNPTYANLFGKVEYYSMMGALQTDFRFIRPGIVHKANGGFLILNAEDILRSPFSWDGIKRFLNSGKVKIENIQDHLGYGITVTLNPEPIEVSTKIIMIGEPWVYDLLYKYEPDFRKFFKIKAPFDWELSLDKQGVSYYLSLIKSIVNEKKLLNLNAGAIEEVMKYGMRLAERKDKLSAQVNKIMALLMESDRKARRSKKRLISKAAVKEALDAMNKRYSLEEEHMLEYVKRNEIMIETTGKKVGQINGLTVLELAEHPFGMPVKITAKTYLGEHGVVDIQREANMSGKIFTKAVLILSSYFASKYAQKNRLSLSATLSFEQTYSMVDGDSASVAETLALISAISKVPIKQSLAVTGSINQHGEVQPVGGVPYKIEGFFKVCRDKGLTGEQGVIIPKSNTDDLVLSDEVVEAVKKGKFHIWPVETVDEAVEIAMEKKAGKMNKSMNYTRGSVNYLVCKELERVSKLLEAKKEKEKKSTTSKKRKESKKK
jgi:lon-related putative ATP-dependent protease